MASKVTLGGWGKMILPLGTRRKEKVVALAGVAKRHKEEIKTAVVMLLLLEETILGRDLVRVFGGCWVEGLVMVVDISGR